jgi:NitT/TauT family transport system substrate-binding protein
VIRPALARGLACPLLSFLILAGCGGEAAPATSSASAISSSAASKPSTSAAISTPASPAASAAAAAASVAVKPPASAAAPASTTALKKVRVGVAGWSFPGVPLMIAQERGYFQQQGLDVDFDVFASAVDIVAPAARNEIQVSSTAPSVGLINALNRDIPLRVVASIGTLTPGHEFLTMIIRKDLVDSGAYKDVQDLKGRTVAIVSPGSGTEPAIDAALAAHGLKMTDIKLVNITFVDMQAALQNKSIDAAFDIEPLITAAERLNLARRAKDFSQYYPNHQTAILAYSPDFAEKDRDAANRWMVAFLRATRDFVDAFENGKGDKESIIGYAMNYIKINDRSVFDTVQFPDFRSDGRVYGESLVRDQDWWFDHGELKQKIDLNKILDYSYVDAAQKTLGPFQKPA